jgi:DNA polymerase-3 subunit gamma/tau
VIDEVHMLSNSAFNAMLKTLEEPPEHMKFVLATTDPQKIPVTVLSRCLQFNLKQMAGPAIVDHLIGVCDEENVQTTPEALRLIAHAAHGSMRDALSLLDQTIAYCSGVLQPDAVRSMLGSVDRDFLVAILEHLGQGDLQRAIEVASDIQARSLSFDEALGELATLLHQIALLQCVPAAELPGLIDRERIAALAERLAPDAVQLYYQIALHGRHDLALAPDDYAGFTMALMRMALFEPQTAQGSAAGHGTEASGAPPMSAGKSVGKSAMAAARARADRGLPEERPAAQPAPRGDFDGDWPSLVRRLGLSGLAKQLAERCALVKHEAGRFELAVGAADRALAENPYQDRLKQALQEHFGRVVSLSCTVGEVKGDTVAAADEAARQAKTREAASLMEGDSFVRSLKSEFGATIDSIRPMK